LKKKGFLSGTKYNATEALLEFLKFEFSLKSDNLINEIKSDSDTNLSQKTNISTNNTDNLSKRDSLLSDVLSCMTQISKGCILMGDNKIGKQNIAIKEDFLIYKFLIKQSFYNNIMGSNPSNFKGEDLPVENISWYDAIEFCNELSRKCGLEPVYERTGKDVLIKYDNNGFRLPTEAEWEYSALDMRNKNINISDYAWYLSNSGGMTHKVGLKKQNSHDLYDLLGNVWEWCNDWYSPYDGSKLIWGGCQSGENKVRKGGSWANFTNNLKPEYRERSNPNFSDNHIGFRIVKKREN
jgi:formylglycine-generating enzyme required for sulfatase activity